MFHQGDLQSGISLAIQQQKLVACFVRKDDDEESKTWEEDWFNLSMEDDKTIGQALGEQAVLLKIQAESQEAGFLSAFCSLERVPKLLIIRNGSVLEDIENGVSQGEFVMRVSSIIGQSESVTKTTAPVSEPVTQPPPVSPPVATSAETGPPRSAEPAANSAHQARVEAMMAERAARMEKHKLEKERAEKEAKRVIAKARKEEEAKAAAEEGAPSKPNWIEQQRIKQKEAKSDRERVLKLIEADKAARREREAQKKMAMQAESSEAGPSSYATQQSAAPRSGSSSANCSLQIRLFDGSSLRTKFASDSTLTSAVRTYVSEQSQTIQPYNFRLMQVPGPSRTIDISEESETLLSLGLCPSATLVLVPVKDYTTAYSGAYSGSIMNRGIAITHGVVNGAYNLVGGVLGTLTGYGRAAAEGPYVAGTGDEQEPSNVQGSRMAGADSQPGPSSNIKIRTLADQRRENQESEFYNGNQLNFEPRKDDDKKD